MKKGTIQVFSGEGHGKSAAVLGRAVQTACNGDNVVIIQFLKGKGLEESEFVKRLEPEVKIFRFEKSDEDFQSLPEDRQAEEILNIRNGLNFARKVANTGGCKLLVLDEVLGLVDNGIISAADLKGILETRPEDMDVLMTGISLDDQVCALADEVVRVENMKFKIWD